MADKIYSLLSSPCSRVLLGLDLDDPQLKRSEGVSERLQSWIRNSVDNVSCSHEIVDIANAALCAFLQATVTGPPLVWNVKDVVPFDVLLPGFSGLEEEIRSWLIASLSVDGEAVYGRLPHVELFLFAKMLLNCVELNQDFELLRARLRVNTWHQRLLNQPSSALETQIYDDIENINSVISSGRLGGRTSSTEFLLEEVAVHLLHGHEAKAKAALEKATEQNSFEFVLTGRLGKRTKFQQKDISQLVVLAKSAEDRKRENGDENPGKKPKILASSSKENVQPQALLLEDDTLLNAIAFTSSGNIESDGQTDVSLPPSLAELDPGDQPRLDPLDAIILLSTASSITNTSPSDGITREETLPFAERVLSGGSSNWQVYTQALLIRSRIEGYRTRTIERGVLQLQALVDQVIAETTGASSASGSRPENSEAPTTFLPRPKDSESAPATERLRYIHQLASPPRWKLESELADRWVSLGALRTALEIYERLGLWAEAALCLAAEGKEDKALKIIKKQLYQHPNAGFKATTSSVDALKNADDYLNSHNEERQPLPPDAPRLFCILGDLENAPSAYERAWTVSNSRFSRAQRSLGKHYAAKNENAKADEAYVKSLKANPQNHATWFALGCIRLQTEDWSGAVEAFGRAVQIEDSDAESWSNLAVSLLRKPEDTSQSDRHTRSAFIAMKKATSLKRDNAKLWQNLLAIGIQLSPPPYAEIVMAQTRLIEILGPSLGESVVDVPVVEALLAHVIETYEPKVDETGTAVPLTGLRKLVIDLITKEITPLITSSRPLWLLVAKLNIHLKRPLAALSTYEKAWRSAINQPGWEASKKQWKDVSDATVELIDAYESLGERERESGLGEGEFVARDWKFKARSAARSVLARAKEAWEGDEEYDRLEERLKELKK